MDTTSAILLVLLVIATAVIIINRKAILDSIARRYLENNERIVIGRGKGIGFENMDTSEMAPITETDLSDVRMIYQNTGSFQPVIGMLPSENANMFDSSMAYTEAMRDVSFDGDIIDVEYEVVDTDKGGVVSVPVNDVAHDDAADDATAQDDADDRITDEHEAAEPKRIDDEQEDSGLHSIVGTVMDEPVIRDVKNGVSITVDVKPNGAGKPISLVAYNKRRDVARYFQKGASYAITYAVKRGKNVIKLSQKR